MDVSEQRVVMEKGQGSDCVIAVTGGDNLFDQRHPRAKVAAFCPTKRLKQEKNSECRNYPWR